jgi:ankyrin repeat protein
MIIQNIDALNAHLDLPSSISLDEISQKVVSTQNNASRKTTFRKFVAEASKPYYLQKEKLVDQFNAGTLQDRVQKKEIDPHTLIHDAILENSPEVIRFLLAHGVDVDYPNESGMSPLTVAILNRCNYAVDVLLEHGANPNPKVRWNNTSLLELAVNLRDYRSAEKLIKYGADISEIRKHLAFLISDHYYSFDLAKLIIERGIETPGFFEPKDNGFFVIGEFTAILDLVGAKKQVIIDGYHRTVADQEKRTAGMDFIGKMIANGFDLNHSYMFELPLIKAIEFRRSPDLEVIGFLIKNGADVNKIQKMPRGRHPDENSPLMSAVDVRNFELVKMLVDAGADVNQTVGDCFSNTPLKRAISNGSQEIAQYLLQRGAKA